MRVYNLSKKSAEDFLGKINHLSSAVAPKLKGLQIAELDDLSLAIIFEKEQKFFFGRRGQEVYFPLLKDEVVLPTLPTATVDIGAVKFVCNGANVMRPGIVSFSDHFEKSALIVVNEASHSKAIAVGRAMATAEEMKGTSKGASIENYHYVGDKFWEALKTL